MKTVSKIGFAALRLGFLIAGEEIVNEVNKVRLPYNVNSLSQLLATEAFNRAPLIQKSVGSIMKERERLFAALRKMRGITPYPSDANFILFKVSNAGDFYAKLLESGILVRNMCGVIKDTLRVTVGTPAENTAFLDAARDALRR
ncbi:MAG: aminotransferase class I/II-fold pyridoxal phosphate-dependent enzyme [Bacillus subtilis]|nr:aminotransferase class I/II-fold pyridoxal phosphate-dependent enzyme [Bacillus subtilis]